MRTVALILLMIFFPLFSQAQFTIGQTTGANVTYHDFPDTSVCSWGLASVAFDLDGDQNNDLQVSWYLDIPHQDCFDRVCEVIRLGTGTLGLLPDYNAQGNDLLAQTYYPGLMFADYCPNYIDSTDIMWIWLDHFGSGGAYMLMQLDANGLDYAWLRARTDTTGGNFCLTFMDAARYRAPVAVDPLSEAGAGLQVFPTIVEDGLWVKSNFKKPVRLAIKYFAIDGRVLGRTEIVFPRGQARTAVPYPDAAAGVVMMEISGNNVRRVEKLVFN